MKFEILGPNNNVVNVVETEANPIRIGKNTSCELCLDRLHVHAFGRQRADRQVDVAVGILLSLLGDRIAEERERVAVLHQDFAERARRHRAGRRKDRLFHVIDFPYGDISIWGYLNMRTLYQIEFATNA